MDCVRLRQRYRSADSSRSSIKSSWDLIERFFIPLRGRVYLTVMNNNSIDWRERQLFDSTAPDAVQTLAASIHGSLTSGSFKWFDLSYTDEELNKNMEAVRWLQSCSMIIYDELNESNFNLEASELYQELVAFGTGFLCLEVDGDYESFNGLDFKAMPIRECCFEADHKGRVVHFYRKIEMTPLMMVEQFGADGVPDHINERVKNDQSVDERQEVIFAIFKRDDKADKDTSKVLAPTERPYGYKYFILDGAEQLGNEGGYYEMPTFAPRWRKTSGATWGYSPAHIALYDTLTLNQLKEMNLGALEKVVDPATITTARGVIGDLDLTAGGNTVVRQMGDIAPFESAARFDVAELNVNDLRQSIRRIFFVDQLELKQSPAMTATEVTARVEMMNRLLGPTAGRLQSDFLDPLIKRAFAILFRAGRFEEMPPVVAEKEGQYKIEYTGPMARSQKSQLVDAINSWMMMTAQMAQIFPEMLDLPKVDEINREVALMSGVPAKYLNSQKELDDKRAERAKQQQAQQSLVMAQQGGDALKAMGEGAAAIQDADIGGIEEMLSGGQVAQ